MQTTKPQFTDKDLLVSMLIYAILETESALRRTPTKAEILDHLFSETRFDPDSRDLARRLDRHLESLLEDWEQMDEWDNAN